MKSWILCIALLLPAASAVARGYAEGDALAPVELQDQHGETRRLDEGARHLVFTREMKAGRVAKAALAEDGAAFLERSGTVYVSDLSRMPRLVRSLFAVPGLRRRAYSVLLDFQGDVTADLPSREGEVTVITLDGLRVAEVRFLDTAEEIRRALTQ